MRHPYILRVLACLLMLNLCACCEVATLPEQAGIGPHPMLPPPKHTLLPTVNIAPAKGWPAGVTPMAADGLSVNAFAAGLDHPRWLYVLPNGDVLVAETNAPPKPEDSKGIKGWIMKMVMKRAGAGVPSANRITLLRDENGDGIAETRTIFLQGLNSPFGRFAGDPIACVRENRICLSSSDSYSGWWKKTDRLASGSITAYERSRYT